MSGAPARLTFSFVETATPMTTPPSVRNLQAQASELLARGAGSPVGSHDEGRPEAGTGPQRAQPVPDRSWERPATDVEPAAGRHYAGTPTPGPGAHIASAIERLVRVQASHSGAGASTVALVLADAADAAGVPTRLLDAAAPRHSGLMAALVTEVVGTSEWRRGRRGARLIVDRPRRDALVPADIPALMPVEGTDLSILDVGWSRRELTASGEHHWLTTITPSVDVLVTATHSDALNQTEAALAALSSGGTLKRTVVVAIGTNRHVRRDLRSAGPRMQCLLTVGAVCVMPPSAMAVRSSCGFYELPRRVRQGAQHLFEHVLLTAHRPEADAWPSAAVKSPSGVADRPRPTSAHAVAATTTLTRRFS
jgi:hypothetical protein